jgi:hypothetical protein
MNLGALTWNDFVNDEKDDLLANCFSILNKEKNNLCRILNVYGIGFLYLKACE